VELPDKMTLKTDIAVASVSEELNPEAEKLAAKLDLPITAPDNTSFALLLVYTGERLELRQTADNTPGPVYVDFLSGKIDYRRRYGSSGDEGLIRAITSKKNRTPTVMDATGGLGRDAFVLAAHGCRVTMVEKNPIIATLLEDGIRRAAADPGIGEMIRDRLQLKSGDSREIMAILPDNKRPEVIYLDPMYPRKNKGAQVKKESQALRLLIGDDLDSPELLAQTLTTATKRAVVKRPSSAPPLAGPEPDLIIKTRKNRFDVYLTNKPVQQVIIPGTLKGLF